MGMLRYKRLLSLHASLLIFSIGVGAAEAQAGFCAPPEGDKSPFEGVAYNMNNAAARCVSAYPRFDDYIVQSAWETVVYRGCSSQYAMVYNGNVYPDYETACRSVEKVFNEISVRWHNNGVIDRVPEPVCASSIESGPDGKKLYTCSIYYSSEQYRNPARPLSETDIVIDN